MGNPFEFFTIERHGRTATLWLDRPEQRNAMGAAFWNELPAAMDEITRDEAIRAAVVAGRGRDFTVGLDLKAMQGLLSGGPAAASRLGFLDEILRLQRSITAVARCPKPIIAAIHGWCLGGGIDLATACDLRYAARDAVFSIRETRIAIVADVGTLQRLPAIVGKGHVAELAYTGRDFDAEHAERIHLVNRVLPDAETTVAAARATAEEIAANSPLAVQGTKRVLEYCEGKSVDDGLQYVATWNAAFLESDDLKEAMRAFREKRAPEFTGR
ncbi:MAG: enoyl-CoA hydratase [Candidatus Binatota bacterium]|nr:enoyl-CoA hydratase [Candidatus Binatota bacterium]